MSSFSFDAYPTSDVDWVDSNGKAVPLSELNEVVVLHHQNFRLIRVGTAHIVELRLFGIEWGHPSVLIRYTRVGGADRYTVDSRHQKSLEDAIWVAMMLLRTRDSIHRLGGPKL